MVNAGYPFYNQDIGILVFNGKSPRIPGDPGNSETFNFQVCYEVINGSFKDLIEGSDDIKGKIIDAAVNLQNKGIKAIVGDCGLMGLYQDELRNTVNIPLIASSLTLIPLIRCVTRKNSKIGLVTGHSELLKLKHFEGAGVTSTDDIIIQGMENESHFKRIVIEGGTNLDTDKMEKDVLNAVGKLLKKSDDISAVLLECSNLASFSHAINKKYGIPVFDINTGIQFLKNAVSPQKYY
ncbi:MAG: hypothetical protein AB9844_04720 [Clostridiaceae bacterium]